MSYFAAEMLGTKGKDLSGRTALVSGSGNVAQFAMQKLIQLGCKPLTFSDSSGYIFDEQGVDAEKLAYLMELKNVRRGRVEEYAKKYPQTVYTPVEAGRRSNPLWNHKADCAFPCATQNEINELDAQNLVKNGIQVVCEGANMPTTPDGINIFQEQGVLFGPAKAANAGGVAVSGLEMSQNSMRLSWTAQEVDQRLKTIMQTIHKTCLDTAQTYGKPHNYVMGANISGFLKVAEAMLAQGVI